MLCDPPIVLPGDTVENVIHVADVLTIDGITRTYIAGHLVRGEETSEERDAQKPSFRVLSPFGTLYMPRRDDVVIGRVVAVLPGRAGYRVDVRGATHATLPFNAFENVVKRTTTGATTAATPVVVVGTHILARVAFVAPNLGAVALSCAEPLTDPDGRVAELPLSAAQNPPRHLLARIANNNNNKTPFSVLFAANGRAWVTALVLRDALDVCRVLSESL